LRAPDAVSILPRVLSTRQKIALARLCSRPLVGARRTFGLPAQVRARRGGLRWRLDLDEGIDFSIWLLGAFERSVARAMRRLVRPGDTVLDIGANVGAHTLPLARMVGPEGRVVAYEPTDWAFAKLCANVAENPALAARIATRQAFLLGGDEKAPPPAVCSSWPLSPSADVHPKLGGRPKATSGAQAGSLDTLLGREAIERVDFVKVDVDGYEGQVLRGAGATLRRHRPTMLIELAPYLLAERGDGVGAVLDLLGDAGYRLFALDRAAPLGGDEVRRLLDGAEAKNFVARATAEAR
jgi:FkbM family methyltransferase